MLPLRRGGLALLAVSSAMVGVAALPARSVTGTAAAPAAVSPIPGASDLQWVLSPQFAATLGTMRPSATATGAYGINARWEAGTSTVWYVSQQEVAADSIAYGIANDDETAIDTGLKQLDWAFAHMQPDGSFEPRYDIVASQVVSSVLFIQGAARALLLLQASSYGAQYAARIGGYRPQLARAVAWVTAEPQWTLWKRHVDGQTGYGVFLHQHYAAAAAIGLTSTLTGDRSEMPKALERIAYAVPRQSTVGWNPEIDGPDSGYGALGVSSALRFAQWLPDSPATPSLMTMLERAIDWERSRIAPDGWIDWTGNTRTCVPREGMKDPGYSTMADHLGAWGVMEGRPDLFAPAAAALQFARTNPSRRCEDRGGVPPGGTWSAPSDGAAVPVPAAAGGGGGGGTRAAAKAVLPAVPAGAQAPAPAGAPAARRGTSPRSVPDGEGDAVTCATIPKLTGRTLKRAKRRLERAGCADTPVRTVGRRRAASRAKRGRAKHKRRAAKHKRRATLSRARVIRQTPKVGGTRRGDQEIILRVRSR